MNNIFYYTEMYTYKIRNLKTEVYIMLLTLCSFNSENVKYSKVKESKVILVGVRGL